MAKRVFPGKSGEVTDAKKKKSKTNNGITTGPTQEQAGKKSAKKKSKTNNGITTGPTLEQAGKSGGVKTRKKLTDDDAKMAEKKVKSAKGPDYTDEEKQAARDVRTKRGQRQNADGKSYGSTGSMNELTAKLDDLITLLAAQSGDQYVQGAGGSGADQEYIPPEPPPTAAPMGTDTQAYDTRYAAPQQQAQGGLRGSGTRTAARQMSNADAEALLPPPTNFDQMMHQNYMNNYAGTGVQQPSQAQSYWNQALSGAGDVVKGMTALDPADRTDGTLSGAVGAAFRGPQNAREAGQGIATGLLGVIPGAVNQRRANARYQGAVNHQQVVDAYRVPPTPQRFYPGAQAPRYGPQGPSPLPQRTAAPPAAMQKASPSAPTAPSRRQAPAPQQQRSLPSPPSKSLPPAQSRSQVNEWNWRQAAERGGRRAPTEPVSRTRRRAENYNERKAREREVQARAKFFNDAYYKPPQPKK